VLDRVAPSHVVRQGESSSGSLQYRTLLISSGSGSNGGDFGGSSSVADCVTDFSGSSLT
jgi:hypothetical protein